MSMKPGRELDALIAEKVMGCNLWRREDALRSAKDQKEYEAARRGFEDFRCKCPDRSHEDSGEYGDPWLKEYSTDISVAWEVVEKLQGGLRFELRRRTDGGFWAYFGEEMSAEGDTAPHAICLAALKALGVT